MPTQCPTYSDCGEANAAGEYAIPKTDPAYRARLDWDGDGTPARAVEKSQPKLTSLRQCDATTPRPVLRCPPGRQISGLPVEIVVVQQRRCVAGSTVGGLSGGVDGGCKSRRSRPLLPHHLLRLRYAHRTQVAGVAVNKVDSPRRQSLSGAYPQPRCGGGESGRPDRRVWSKACPAPLDRRQKRTKPAPSSWASANSGCVSEGGLETHAQN